MMKKWLLLKNVHRSRLECKNDTLFYDQDSQNQLKLIPYLWPKQLKNHTHTLYILPRTLSAKLRADYIGLLVQFLPNGYAMLMRPNKAETAVHCCHCLGGIAVRKVLARPWVGVWVCHLLLLSLVQQATLKTWNPKHLTPFLEICNVMTFSLVRNNKYVLVVRMSLVGFFVKYSLHPQTKVHREGRI